MPNSLVTWPSIKVYKNLTSRNVTCFVLLQVTFVVRQRVYMGVCVFASAVCLSLVCPQNCDRYSSRKPRDKF